MKNYCDGGEAIVQAFRNLGVDYVFSSPGSEWGSLWEAFARQQVGNISGPKYVSCWHETLAVNMATGYTAVTGRMQAVVLHAGVGLLQGSMGVHGARKWNIPMVVMSGEALTFGDDDSFDPGAQWYQALSVVGGPQRLLEPIVKWSTQVTSAAVLHEMVVRAGELAQRAPVGPVYLNVPIEAMAEPWNRPDTMRSVPAPPKLMPHDSDIMKVAELLVAAKAPVITTEGAGRDVASYAALLELAELLAIPVVESASSEVNNFPRDHELHQGFRIRPHLTGSDVVVVLRCRTPWYPPRKGPTRATVVVIDEAPFRDHMVYQNLQGNLFLEGHVAYSLARLVEAIRALGFDKAKVDARRSHWRAQHDKLQAEYREIERKAGEGKTIDPVTACRIIGETLPRNSVYVDETTTHRDVIRCHVPFFGPQSHYKVPGGLGQGLGVALGVKLAMPDRPVVSLIGDGAFLYNPVPQSLGLSADAKLPILIIVFNNRGYRAMKRNHLSYYPDGVSAENKIFLGETIHGPNFGELAKPFGGVGFRVEQAVDLKPTLQSAMKAVDAGQTAIVDLLVN